MSEIRMVVPDELDNFLESQVRTGTFSSKAELARAALTEYVETLSTVSSEYDTENIFSPEGRVYQMEYAREAGYKGKTVIGIEGKDEIVMAADVGVRNADVSSSDLAYDTEKIIRTDNDLLITGSGLALDMMKVIKELENYEIDRYKDLRYALADIFHDHSLGKGVRPLGTVLLIGANFEGEHYLVEVDSSGAHRRMKAAVLGKDQEEIKEDLSERYEEGMESERCENICKELLEDSEALQIEKLS